VNVGFVESNAAAFANVPGNRTWVIGVRLVGTCLAVNAHRPDAAEDHMDGEREQRVEDAHDVQDHFDEQDEHGEHGDDNVEIRQKAAPN